MCQPWLRALRCIDSSFDPPPGDRAHEHFHGTNEDTELEMLNTWVKPPAVSGSGPGS